MKKLCIASGLLLSVHCTAAQQVHIIQPLTLRQVEVRDSFWSPKYRVWTRQTVYDVFDKLEGRYQPDRPDLIDEKKKTGVTRNAFLNFDIVAQGKSNTGVHDGPPWYDGLVYESIRGAADLLISYPDLALEEKLDAYIARIVAAQQASGDGYLNTYTTLMRPSQRWGTNGGDDNWQHECYNAGMLTEAGVHYYQATGKTALLEAAIRICNLMAATMGPPPRMNVIPGHGGPEEALLKLYWLFQIEPPLSKRVTVEAKPSEYLRLATFWIENRGDHGERSGNRRPDFGAYDQDDKSVFEQTSIEGHAVRATLLATGIAATALQNRDPRYVKAADIYWNSMAAHKTFITGGQGAIHDQEKFGPNYFLPESAYLETCAAIGSAFFSARMNELFADGKYVDAFERTIYNNMLSGVSLSGDRYFYENPLKATDHKRWEWHSCPCCPPMILKAVGLLPAYIYATEPGNVYVNLFIGSRANIPMGKDTVLLEQRTGYPWTGQVAIGVTPSTEASFTVRIRIPGWATGAESPFGLYTTQINANVKLFVNGKQYPITLEKGYAVIDRRWRKGDVISLQLPVSPRYITANNMVADLRGKVAIAAGPLIYAFETIDNPGLDSLSLRRGGKLEFGFQRELLNGVNVISGESQRPNGQRIPFRAVPFFSLGNREPGAAYRVWVAD